MLAYLFLYLLFKSLQQHTEDTSMYHGLIAAKCRFCGRELLVRPNQINFTHTHQDLCGEICVKAFCDPSCLTVIFDKDKRIVTKPGPVSDLSIEPAAQEA